MSEIALAVLDPDGNRHAQLLHDDLPVQEVVIILAHRLELPSKLDYELFPAGGKKALDPVKTLQAQKIKAGADLEIRPVRNSAFETFIEALKAEILYEAKGEARRQARQTLASLLGSQAADAELASAGGTAAGSGAAAASSSGGGVQAAPDPGAASTQATQSTGSGSTQASSTTATKAKATTRSGGSCLRWGCGIVVVGGLALAAALYFLYDDYVAPIFGSVIEQMTGITSSGEPVLGTGDVQVTLRWDNPVDLDLHVYDPSGEEVWFGNTNSASGGTLDVDANALCTNDAPVENVYWPTGGAPHGSYSVYVTYYQDCGYSGASAYSVSLLVDGVTYGPYEGVFSGSSGEQQYVTGFDR